MPKVLNINRDLATVGAIVCMRGHVSPAGDPLGNPFIIGRNGTRKQVCAKYANWAPLNDWWPRLLRYLRGHDLMCCCAPHQCHCDFLLKEANK